MWDKIAGELCHGCIVTAVHDKTHGKAEPTSWRKLHMSAKEELL